MHRRRIILFAALAAVLALAAGAAAWFYWPSKKTVASAPFDLYFTCDVSGRIEPCGCFAGQYGGLTRVSTILQKKAATALKVDIGDALAGLEDFHLLQYRHVLRSCAAMGYQAMNLGQREARLSAQDLRELVKSSPVPLLSANLLDAKTGQPLAASARVVTQGKLRIGLIGVVDPASLEGKTDPQLRLIPMADALRREIPDLKKKSDILVCLAFTNEVGLESLARDFYELHFILGGNVPQPSPALKKINQSHLLATTNESKALGEIHATFGQAALTKVSGDITLMNDKIPQDGTLAAISGEYRQAVRHAVLNLDSPAAHDADRVPGVAPDAVFAESVACGACHPKAFASWANTRHASAFASLIRKDSEADPNCIACHTVGFGEPGGYRRAMGEKQLVNVGCESCHGPGSEHIQQRQANAASAVKMRAVGAGQCVQCHHGEFSRPFVWEEFWPHVRHGKETE